MTDLPTILLTGFTGVLGKRYAYRLAERGYRVICPIRAKNEAEAKERFLMIFYGLRDLLPSFDETLVARLQPIPGDVREKNLGIPSSFWEELKGPRTRGIWHLAALLDLTETNSAAVYETNYLGTLHVLDFARQQGIPEFHYFSTFGASGWIKEGIIREIPGIKPPAFRNTYERTKWEAERRVWQAQIRGDLSVTIYRPSIVVGDSLLGRYEQFNVFNHVFDVISRVRERLCEKEGLDAKTVNLKHTLRVQGDRKATLNIIPMDYAVDAVMKIYAAPGSRGRVYHITNPQPPSLGMVERIFRQNVHWDGVRWEMFDPQAGFLNPYEKFVAKQMSFLTPYLLGEGIYDNSNARAALALHGGLPPIRNEVFMEAIVRRGRTQGWQEVKAETLAASIPNRRSLEDSFKWPEDEGPAADFFSSSPENNGPPSPHAYSLVERTLGKIYRLREKFFAGRGTGDGRNNGKGRDLVLTIYGMGASRRGEGEANCFRHNEELALQVFARMNQALGFDLRAFSRREVPGHARFDRVHDNCCLAVADGLIHVLRLFSDLRGRGISDFVPRLQILPQSGGIYLAAWLSGGVSFEDMLLLVNQCGSLISEYENQLTQQEIERWFFHDPTRRTTHETAFFEKMVKKLGADLAGNREFLSDRLHGKLELVFSLNAHVLEKLIAETRRLGIDVLPAITMSPNTVVFAGNELEMSRFRDLFVGKRRIELRRLPLEILGSPHFPRLKKAGDCALELLEGMERQGRIRDPVVPFPLHTGEWVRTRRDLARAVAGIADQLCAYDQMISRVMEQGGRHFLLLQSGLAATAGDLLEGVLLNIAHTHGIGPVTVYRPATASPDPHPITRILGQAESSSFSSSPPNLEEMIKWYEGELAKLRGMRNKD